MVSVKDIFIENKSQNLIGATIYCPKRLKAAVMMAPATGIKRGFYDCFSKFLMDNGYGVITYDNSGIGDSLSGKINKSKASLLTWGQEDMPTVLETLKVNFPNTKYHIIGHSAGGQLVGLMPNSKEFSSMFNVSCSSGSIKNMMPPFKLKAKLFMNFFIPLSNSLLGYTNSPWFGMGEPLPSGVAKEWSSWCSGSAYVKMAFGKTILKHWYDDLSFPSLWLNATDDFICTEKNIQEMIAVYTRMPYNRIVISPEDSEIDEIGHMKFFSKRNKKLWYYVLDWLHNYQ